MSFKVVIADDHPLFRSALKQAVESVLGCDVLQSASLDETRRLLSEHADTELVFLDLNMPGNQGLTGLSSLRSEFSDVLVVMVSAEEDPQIIRKALDLGASGYIPKSASLDQLSDAVAQVMDGEQWVPQSVMSDVQSATDHNQKAFAEKMQQLTPHQFKVLKLIADGMLNKQIAYELNVQETTIKQHVSAVLRKLDVINRTQAGIIFKQIMGE
ncbi:response regulator [Neptunicella marina]|uniref:Response regulator transcription factor n=1 Tax=Neptunicella marina TaxID=2125989 RepID=A0A8J6IS91_9ALTE|nr:response regulator transcription factor [Neptunicella marina]MBC3764651.1 response regulator transcription factor [Neptunicella marina]